MKDVMIEAAIDTRMFDRIIVVDFDGVCGDWESYFEEVAYFDWGFPLPKAIPTYYIPHRNPSLDETAVLMALDDFESNHLSFIPPMRDAIKYIRKLHEEHGYVFHCITAVSDDDRVYQSRWQCIQTLFGQTAFTRLIHTNGSDNKRAVLEHYRDSNCYWIEDVIKNAMFGAEVGMKPILMNQHYNLIEEAPEPIVRVNNWREIYNIITQK